MDIEGHQVMSIDVTCDDPAGAIAPAATLRRNRGWTQARLAQEFVLIGRRLGLSVPSYQSLIKQISRLESGQTQVPDALYQTLWTEALGVDAQLLFDQATARPATGSTTFALTSHKFIPAILSTAAMAALGKELALLPAEGQWWEGCLSAPLGIGQHAQLYVWPWQTAVVHIVERLEFSSIVGLAMHRRTSYPEARTWVDSQLTAATKQETASAYTFSAYWVDRPKWHGDALDTAMRLISMPSVLLNREDDVADDATLATEGHRAEAALLDSGGVDREDLTSFGATGVSVAYASWSSVAYHPIAPRRALAVDELVACQVLAQGLWAYTADVLQQVERGEDPQANAEYGRRFLRAVRSRLTVARPTETGQARSMRTAVVTTSGLVDQLDAAMNVLLDNDPKG